MRVRGLDHVNITGPWPLLERCVTFYTEVLGLREGERPQFRRRGFWLYAGDAPVVHLTEGEERAAGGAVDHVAFACDDLEATEARLRALGVELRRDRNQLFLRDPAGVGVELNFG